LKHILKYSFLVLCGMVVFSYDAYAQFVISGKVTDAVSDEPIPFANVYMKELRSGGTTDMEGNYKITSSYISDSICVSYIGYAPLCKKLSAQKEQTIHFSLQRSDISLQEIVILPGENPAHIILRKVIEHKEANHKNALRNYQYEAYSKVELDLYDFNEKFTERKIFQPFSFIFHYIDSTTEDKPFLPVFITESLSDVYFAQEPRIRKEIIKATRMSGVRNESIAQFLSSMQQEIDIYNNWPVLLDRSFVSPISDGGLNYYKYYLLDSAIIDGHKCYKLNFVPKGKGAMTFTGEMWIADSSFAVKQLSMEVAPHVNLNFVEKLSVQQQYNLINGEAWMLTKDKITIRFKPMEKMSGIIGRKTLSFRDFRVNMPEMPARFATRAEIETARDVFVDADTFWLQHRHESLSESEQAVYQMVDSLSKNKRFNTYVDIFKTIIGGYYVAGAVEVGPYLSTISYNQVQGWRPRIGMRTSNNFSKRVMLGGYAAYGTNNHSFNYGVNGTWLIQKKPRISIGFEHINDADVAATNQADLSQENLLAGFLRRNIPQKLIHLNQTAVFFEKEFPVGFAFKTLLRNKNANPYRIPGYWDFKYLSGKDDRYNDSVITRFHTTEASFRLRFAYQEKFLSGEFERVSLGSKKPIVELTYTLGVKNLLLSGFNYHRIDFRLHDRLPVNPIGSFYYDIFCGKIFGRLPYLMLHIPQGNETYFFNTYAFNMMNEYEFAADQYLSVFLRHYFEGFFFNKIPGIRKLKLRELIFLKAMTGSMTAENRYANSLNNFIVPGRIPYVEMGAGIENIFKLFRIDFIWRLTYRNQPYTGNFGVRAGMSLSF
jgi:hypothetical protein